MSTKIWQVAERQADDIIEHLLLLRELDTEEKRDHFFSPTLNSLASPDSFDQMTSAVNRIEAAILKKEPVVVWGDFDADGVTSTAVVWETLHQLGASVMPYIPSRETEGHGFSEEGLAKLKLNGTKLIITVDHGIAAIDEVKKIHEMGIEVIISDHHEPRLRHEVKPRQGISGEAEEMNALSGSSYILPEAVAVVHPLLMDEPQPLAGCGVAYLLSYAVWLRMTHRQDDESARVEFARDKIELAGIGTIADMVPLLKDNRVFASYGLASLPSTSRVGLQQMIQLAGIGEKKKLGAYDVGFGIGPRLNAPGRLADALESLRLLCTKDMRRAVKLAQDLETLNKHRQDLLTQVTEEAKAEALKHADGVYVVAKPNWPAGVCGLAAGKIVEKYHRPAVVMEVMGDISRGSARSIKGFDITAALNQIADDLESYGGHAMAAGFVAKTEKLPEIEQKLSQILFSQLSEDELKPKLHIDAEVGAELFDWSVYEKLQKFEPTGMANHKPVFMMSNLEVISYKTVGSDGKHLKLVLKPVGQSQSTIDHIEGIAFNLGYWTDQLTNDVRVDVVFGLDMNEWNGRKTLQMMVKDIRLSEAG